MRGYTNIKADEFDVVFGFDYGRLNNIPDSYSIGHVGLLLKLEGKNLLYLDPGPRNYGVRKVNIDDLYIAIKNKSDGLWIIKSTGHSRVSQGNFTPNFSQNRT